MPTLYKNIRNGKEEMIADSVFQNDLISLKEIEKEFFRDFSSIIESFKGAVVTDSTMLYTVKYRKIQQTVHILVGPLKNSGLGSPNKRIQVSSRTPVDSNGLYIALGGYNTIDTHMYFAILQGIRGYILRAQTGSSYSSLWFNYKSIFETYQKGIYTWEDKIGRTVIGCKKDNILKIHEAIIKQAAYTIPPLDSSISVETEVNEFTLVDFSKEIGKYSETDELPRNPLFRETAFKRENFTCELCGTHKTFTDKNNEQYFEGHHLIMYNPSVQRRYKYCLDHPDNIICLCPNCHRRIHNSSPEDTGAMLIDLFSKHKDLRSEFEVDNLKVVLNDYLI